MTEEPEVNSRLKRIITDPGEAAIAYYDAHEEFVNKMAEHPHLSMDIAPASLDRWYGKVLAEGTREERIFAEFGPAESTMLTTTDRSDQ